MKFVFVCLAIGCILGSIWTYRLVWGKPDRFNHFVERVTLRQALRDPELITYLGIVDNTPLDFFSDKLTDISREKNNASLEATRDSLATLHEYERSRLNSQEKLTYDILETVLSQVVELDSFGYGSCLNSYALDVCPYPVNQMFGIQNSLPEFMVDIHRVTGKKSGENYISRLLGWEKKFTDLIAELKLREKSGVVLPKFAIEKVLIELKEFIQIQPKDNVLYISFKNKLQNLPLSDAERRSLEKRALEALEKKVFPAYVQLIGYLEEQKTLATEEDGVWKFPNGDAFYAFCLRYHTTTDYTPEQVHTIGLSEVARIQEEMKQVAASLGYPEKDLKSVMRELGEDPKFLYPDTVEGRTQLLADFREMFRQIEDKMHLLFSHFPKGVLRIDEVPSFKSKTAPMAYYMPGDLLGKRPGVFYVNTHEMKNQTKFTMPSLAYHEGVPGHHFQIARALEIENLPTFRKIVPFTAYQEGWALYCEQLAKEYGFTADPFAELGRQQMELMRAVRLVVDTGIHHKQWTRARAIEYMCENTGQNESEVTIEIERYIVMPGQACGYKIGMIKILELRDKMRERMGPDFDIKVFHEIVLENGALPLTLLEKRVDEFCQI